VTSNPVFLLHGFGTSAASTWGANGWIDLLRDAGRQVIAPDLLGHGSAAKPHDPLAYVELENEAAAALEAAAPGQPVDAIGFSLGARVILTLASASPERFGKIVVAGVGDNLFREGEDPEALAAAIESTGAPEHPWAAYFHQLAHAPGNDPEALAAYLRRPHGTPITDDGLAAITSPVLVVIGDRDHAGPATPLVDRLKDATLVTLPNTDHFATPKNFAFIDAALEFLGASI
jgi:pimeloyl-ACP methyl ester carboxylesterase